MFTRLLFLIFLLLPVQGYTAIINIINTDTEYASGKYADLQGLEWLSLDHTAGLSRETVEDGFTDRYGNAWAKDDWRYATRLETANLLQSLWDGISEGWSLENGFGSEWFGQNFTLLGYDTGYGADRVSAQNIHSFDSTFFYYGTNEECFSGSNQTCVGSVNDFDINPVDSTLSNNGWFHSGYGLDSSVSLSVFEFRNSSISDLGSLLVRGTSVPEPPPVPAPPAIWLFITGLIGLGITRRKLKNTLENE